MRLHVLGPVNVEDDGSFIDAGTPRQRAVLGYLGLRVGSTVSTESISDLLWGDEPPASATKTIQAYLSRLRAATGLALPGEGGGYRLDLAPEQVDCVVMASALAEAATALANGELETAHHSFERGLRLWRSAPLPELPDSPRAQIEAAHQVERFLTGTEDHHQCRLALGHHSDLVAELETFCAANPTRERSWGHLMLALYRAGRQADALRAYQRARQMLAEELGIDPGDDLRQLEARILQQDPALQLAPTPAATTSASVTEIGHQLPDAAPAGLRSKLTVTPLHLSKLNGRRSDLDGLHRWLDGGSGMRLHLLAGAPGIGKTTLAKAFCRELDGEAIAIWGNCTPGLTISYQPMIECARDLITRCDPDQARWLAGPDAPFLTYLMPELVDVFGKPERVHRDVVEQRVITTCFELIGRAGTIAPVVMVMDDLMWASDNTLAVLRHALRSPELGDLCVLATHRPVSAPDAAFNRARSEMIALGATTTELDGLDRDAAAEMFDHTLDASSLDDLLQATHGHPLFLRALRDSGAPPLALEHVPDDIAETVRRWADPLDAKDHELLAGFAVIINDVSEVEAAEVLEAPLTDLLDVLDRGEELGLVRSDPTGGTTFTHELVRMALADTVPTRRRDRLRGSVS